VVQRGGSRAKGRGTAARVAPAVLALPVLRRGDGLGLGLGLGSRPPPPPLAATASSQEAAGDGVAGGCCWPRMTGEKAAPGEPDTVGTEETTVCAPASHVTVCRAQSRAAV